MAVDVEPAASPSDTGRDAGDGGDGTPERARRRWSPRRVLLGVAALAGLAGLVVITGGSEEDPVADPVDDAAPSLSGELEDGFVAYTDPETGISLQYPETWVPLRRPDESMRLVVGPGGGSSLSVRVSPIDGTVDTAEKLAEVQAVTDRIAGAPGVQVVKREAIELNGMVGIFYLGRFTDEASGTKVANAHYFLFEGNTMYVLLFQAVPEEEFDSLAPDFDKVLASFQAPPGANAAPPAEG